MLVPAAVLLGLLLSDGDSLTRRQHRPTGLWFQPQLRFHSLGGGRRDFAGSDMSGLPFGLQIGRQLGPRLMLSAAGAYTPVQNNRATQATAGARWYFRDDALAFYFATELGIMKLEVDDSGGQANIHIFFLAGPGIELSLHNGFSIMTDLQLGPENSGTVSSDHRGWHFSAWYRLGIGYRL